MINNILVPATIDMLLKERPGKVILHNNLIKLDLISQKKIIANICKEYNLKPIKKSK